LLSEGYEFVDLRELGSINLGYEVKMCIEAVIIMNLHSHMEKHEIIGLLAGKLIENYLIIFKAFPGRTLLVNNA